MRQCNKQTHEVYDPELEHRLRSTDPLRKKQEMYNETCIEGNDNSPF
jgi:hypothetical protein